MFKKTIILLTMAAMPFVIFAQAVEEVTVTATRQAESLQDIALSVQAISGEDLMDQHIESAMDLAETTVGIKTANGIGSGFGVSIRGLNMPTIGAGTIAPGQTNINGHVITASAFAEVGFLDAERLEILEGPQGTLYGRNTTTGLINLITAKPGAGNYLKASYGEDGYTMLKGAYDFDVTNDLIGRVAISSFTKDGTVMNLGTGNKVDDRDAYGARLSLDYTINDTSSLAFNFETYKIDDNRLNLGAASCARDSFFGCSPLVTSVEDNINTPYMVSGTVSNTFDSITFINSGTDQYLGSVGAAPASIDIINKTRDAAREQELDFAQLEYSTSFDVQQGGIDVKMKWSNSVNDYFHLDDNDHNNASEDIASAFQPLTAGGVGTMTIASLPTLCYGTLTNVKRSESFECSTVNTEENQWEVNLVSDFDGPFNFTAGAYVNDSKNKNAYNIQTTGYLLMTNFGNHPLSGMFTGGRLDGYGGQGFYSTLAATLGATANAAALGAAIATAGGDITAAGVKAVADPLVAAIDTACLALASNAFNPCIKTMPAEAGGLISDQRTNRKDKAIYGELYFDLNDDMKLTLGARYMNDRFRSQSQQGLSDSSGAYANPSNVALATAYAAAPAATTGSAVCTTTDYAACYAAASVISSDSSEATTYKGAFQYYYDEGMAYVSVTQGHRAGGSNPDATPYGAAKSTSYEIGTKNILLDGALKMNATLFRHEEDSAQYSVIRVNSAYVEPHDLVHQGLQLDTQLFLSESTILSAQALLTDSSFETSTAGQGLGPGGAVVSIGSTSIDPHNPTGATSFTNFTNATLNAFLQTAPGGGLDQAGADAAIAALIAGCASGTGQTAACANTAFSVDNLGNTYVNPIGLAAPICASCSVYQQLGGNSIPGVSDLEAVVGITQLFEGFGGTGSATLSYSFKDEAFGDIYNNDRFKVGSQEYFDFNAQYQPNNGDWYVNLWAKNLADKRQLTSTQRTSNLQGQIIFLTFSEGIRAGVDFGINF